MEPLSALRQLNPQIDRLAIERDSGGTHRQNGHEHTGDGEKKPIIRGAWRMIIRLMLVMRRDAHSAPGTCLKAP